MSMKNAALANLVLFCLTSDVRINGKRPVKLIKGRLSEETVARMWVEGKLWATMKPLYSITDANGQLLGQTFDKAEADLFQHSHYGSKIAEREVDPESEVLKPLPERLDQ